MTAETRIKQVKDHLIRAITEDPTTDYKMLEKATCGLVTKDAKEGNGLDIVKKYYRSLRYLGGETATGEIEDAPIAKRRGRKPGSKNKVATTATTKAKAKAKATTTTTTTTTTKPAVAVKRRGRPKGSKNKPKAVEQPTTES